MAVGIDFLSKTSRLSGMTDIMKSRSSNKNFKAQPAASNAVQNKSSNSVANMNTSDLLKYVYNNQGKFNNKDIQLPSIVEYNDQEFAANGKSFDDMVKIISQKTGDSISRVESELKKSYMTVGGHSSGKSLNMQA